MFVLPTSSSGPVARDVRVGTYWSVAGVNGGVVIGAFVVLEGACGAGGSSTGPD